MFINEYKFNKAKIGYEKILEKKKKKLFLQLVAITCNQLQLVATRVLEDCLQNMSNKYRFKMQKQIQELIFLNFVYGNMLYCLRKKKKK